MTEYQEHEAVWKILKRSVLEAKPAHAYLFSGMEGIGKFESALHFAAMLNCAHFTERLDCECRSCKLIHGQTHPDLFIIRPEKSTIKIDVIRDLQHRFRFAPTEALYRCAIIDDAHLLNRFAQNSLLKTLEEPPNNRIIILITANPAQLLPTIRSRCRQVRFGPLQINTVQERLEKHGVENVVAAQLASMSGGSLSKALELNGSKLMQLRGRTFEILEDPSQFGISGLLAFSAQLSGDKNVAIEILELAIGWIRDVFVFRTGPDSATYLNQDHYASIKTGSESYTDRQLLEVYDIVVQSKSLLSAEYNVNRNLILDRMFLGLLRILCGNSYGIKAG